MSITTKVPLETKEIKVPVIETGGLDIYKDEMRKALGNLVFRRVEKVVYMDESYLGTSFTFPDLCGNLESIFYEKNVQVQFSEDEVKRNVGEHYMDFSVFTSLSKLRKDDGIEGEIYGHSEKYADFDFISLEFYPVDRTIIPRKGDLVCGAVSVDKNGSNAQYSYWFVCSEQFLRFWTLLMYDNHETFHKLIEKNKDKTQKKKFDKKIDEEILRRKVLSGNHLMSAGLRKWLLSCRDTVIGDKHIVSNRNEIFDRFWLHRTEYASQFVHIYTALISILRYREMPCLENVPNNLNGGPVMRYWDLPQGWLENMYMRWNLTSEIYSRFVQVQILDTVNPPAGTQFVEHIPQENLGQFINMNDENIFIPFQNFE